MRIGAWVLATLLGMGVVVARAEEAGAGGAATGTATATPTATLLVTVSGSRSPQGAVVIAMFTGAEGWPKLGRAQRVLTVPAADPVRVRVEGLAPGACAISAFHDENGNGTLDMRWLPLPHPAERTGASRGATGRLGPPSFEAARIACPAGEVAVPIALAD